VFERFTEQARHAVALAQGEALELGHPYVGTEHLLLALLREGDCVAARVLASFGVTAERARTEVLRRVPSGHEARGPQLPFSPRAKKALELSLQHALALGHNYVGTEHVLLGIADTDEGQGAHVLGDLGVDRDRLNNAVVRELSGPGAEQPPRHGVRRAKGRRAGPGVSELEGGFRVVPGAEVMRLFMAAAGRALEDGRTEITVADVRAALASEPPEAAAGG
jgi:ATP-dependent Clp protease ATP-binding subunit ClpC